MDLEIRKKIVNIANKQRNENVNKNLTTHRATKTYVETPSYRTS